MTKLETINQFLKDKFGIDTEDKEPIFRVVWSDSQFEKRETNYTDSGIALIHPEVRELPKYPWVKHMYILERRVLVPDESLKELAGLRKSYEPIWVFKGADNNPVPPTIPGCEFIIDSLYAALGKKSMAKYKDPMAGLSAEEQYAIQQKRIDAIQEELFGDESGLGGETHNESGAAIIVPRNYDTIN